MLGVFLNPDTHNARRESDGLGTDRSPLPLNLMALIISYLSDPADLARACRTCRIFHYMCLPALYSHVRLRSYDHIRYSPETAKPEGCGGGSPFSMGLNALVTRTVANYVKKFEVCGQWQELGYEDHAKVGRVADGAMMLSLLVRAALDRMGMLSSFSWDLDTKMLPVVWQGLCQKATLTSLSVRFPSSRLPSPASMVPPMHNLRSLTITNIDPLCHPDNISSLLCDSVNIEHLRLHWSPRMRREREPSVNLLMYFGKIFMVERKLKLKSLGMQNMYAPNYEGHFLGMYDPNYLESMTAIDSSGGADDDANMSFVAQPPKRLAKMPRLRMLRGNKVSRQHCDGLKKMEPLQKYFLLSGRVLRDHRPGSTYAASEVGSVASPRSLRGSLKGNGHAPYGDTPQSNPESSHSLTPGGHSMVNYGVSTPSSMTSHDGPIINLGRDYLDNIFQFHGRTLTHLLLLPQWRLTTGDISRLCASCFSLQQLGCNVEAPRVETLGLFIPQLPKLSAIRILDNLEEWDFSEEDDTGVERWFDERIAREPLWKGRDKLKWIGLGDLVFEVAKRVPDRVSGAMEDEDFAMNGEDRTYREMLVRRPLVTASDVEIWKMDRLDICV